jgi:small subunit ribosomal protein S4
VRHGHVEVNGRKVNIPSFQVSVGDVIKVRTNASKFTVIESSREFASHQPAPAWLEINAAELSGKIIALPKREDIQLPVNEQLIVELYSK